jgi:hypothetical protein
MKIDTEQLAKEYAELSDEKLLRMLASGKLTETDFNVLEAELTRRGIPLPERGEITKEVPVKMPISWGFKNFILILGFLFSLYFLYGRYLIEIPCPPWLSDRLAGGMGLLWAVGVTCLVSAVVVGVVRQVYDYLYRSAGRVYMKDESGEIKEVLVGTVPPKVWYQFPYSRGIRVLSWFLVTVLSAVFGLLIGTVVYPPENGVLTSKVIFTILQVCCGRFLISLGIAKVFLLGLS